MSGLGINFAPSFEPGRNPRGQAKNKRYGTGSSGPHSDLNMQTPMVARNAASERDQRQQDMIQNMGGADKTYAVRGGVQELESLVNARQQKSYPNVIRQIIIRNALSPNDPHFSLLPTREISEDDLKGYRIDTYEVEEHMPMPQSEFVPSPYLTWKTRSHTQHLERIGIAYRINGDIAFTEQGFIMEMRYKQSVSDQLFKYAACKITQSLISIPDRYRTKRSQTLGAQLSRSELDERRNTFRGPMNHGELLADPGMFGVLNRPQGFEFMMAFVQRMFSEHGFELTHILKNRGILENIAFTPSRTQYANRGEEANRILKGGEAAMNALITERYQGLTLVDEQTYTAVNTPNQVISLLRAEAQVGRYFLCDNEPYEEYISTVSDYGDRCKTGGMRVNDLYYLDLTGQGHIACKKYEELVNACACFDEYGRLNGDVYSNITDGDWQKFAKEKLHMNITDASRFKIDPWIVSQGGRPRVVKIVGNQDTYYTNSETMNVIKNAACRSMQKMIDRDDYRAMDAVIKFMQNNYNVACDTEGNVEAFHVATAWENVSMADLEDGGVSTVRELDNTMGGVRPPRLSPIMTNNLNQPSGRYMAFTKRFGNRRFVLAKVPIITRSVGGSFSVTEARAARGPRIPEKMIELAKAFPHYVWIPDTAVRGGYFNDVTQELNVNAMNDAGVPLRAPVTLANSEDMQLAVWPRGGMSGAIMPSFYTIGCMRALVDTYETDSTARGWLQVIGEEKLRQLRDGMHALDNYAVDVKSIFSPSGSSIASLDNNLFFRESFLPAYQRVEDDIELNELTAFLQNAVCNVAGETGMVSPFYRAEPQGGFYLTPRYAAPVMVNNARHSVGAYRTAANPGDISYPGIPEGTNQNAYDDDDQGNTYLVDLSLPTGENAAQASYTRDDHRKALRLLGFDIDRFDDIANRLRQEIGNADTGSDTFTAAEWRRVKDYMTVGYMLHNLQTSDYDMRKYFLDQAQDNVTAEETGNRDWERFRSKWYSHYVDETLVPALQRLVKKVSRDITDRQLTDVLNRTEGSGQPDLKVRLNVTAPLLNAFFESVGQIGDPDREKGPGVTKEPPAFAEAREFNFNSKKISQLIERVYSVLYAAELRNQQPAAGQAASSSDTSSPGTEVRADRVRSMRALYTYLESSSRVKHIVPLRMATSDRFWQTVERVANEIYGNDLPQGYGASLSILRPASKTEPGEFAGAPPIDTAVPTVATGVPNWHAEYKREYENIMSHAGACRKHGGATRRQRGGRTNAEISLHVLPVFANAGVGMRTGGGHYNKRTRGGDGYGYAHYGGARYGRDDGMQLPAAMSGYDEVLGNSRKRVSRYDQQSAEDAYDVALSGIIPGVSADEMPNEFFVERLRNLGADVENRWMERSVMYAYLGATVSAQLMCMLHKHGIPAPMTMLVFEPFINMGMRSIIFAQGGDSLGFLAHCMNITREGWDTISTEYHVQITTYMGGIILQPEQVLTLPYAIHESLEKGGQLHLVKHYANMSRRGEEEEYDWDVENPMQRKDGFVTHGGGSLRRQDLPDHIPLTGQVHGMQYSTFADRVLPEGSLPRIKDNEQAYPSAILLMILSQIHELNENPNIPERAHAPECIADLHEYPPGRMTTSWNMYCSISNQWMKDPKNIGQYIERHHGCAPAGHFEPGDGAIINGVPAALRGSMRDKGLIVGSS